MNKFKFILTGIILLLISYSQAQVNVYVGSPPNWGPAGYNNVRYYYLPEVQSYYDIQTSKFIYNSGGVWVRRTYLPTKYRNYDLYKGYKVVLTDYHGNKPHSLYKGHKVKYSKAYHGGQQHTIGTKPGNPNPAGKVYPGNNKNQNKSRKPGHSPGKGHKK